MPEELTNLPPEEFLQLAVARGGLGLDALAQGLSPEAARALFQIAASGPEEPVTRGITRSAPTAPRAQATCSACGRVNQPDDRFCRACGRPLAQPQPTTLDDLVKQGHLTPEQADEARAKLAFLQSNYTAGTRYSVFG
jgi:hypothetical protein